MPDSDHFVLVRLAKSSKNIIPSGIGVVVAVAVGNIGVNVGEGVNVGGISVEAGIHPLSKTVSAINTD